METAAWISGLFDSIDRKDGEAFAAFLGDDVVFRFGNAEAVSGRVAVTAAVEHFFASIRGLHHEIGQVWGQGDTVICHGTVTYTRHDGSRLSVPFANIFTLSSRRISRYLIFADISALYT